MEKIIRPVLTCTLRTAVRSCLRRGRQVKLVIARRKYVKYFCRYLFRRTTLLVLLVLFIGYLHFFAGPRASETYNKKCYLSDNERKDMVYLLTNVVETFNRLSVTYWLEYGTMLGIWRQGEIIPYDGDIDIARLYSDRYKDYAILSRAEPPLKQVGIKLTVWQASYKNFTVDLYRMTEMKLGDRKFIERYPPDHFGWLESIVMYFMPASVPSDIVLPTREITAYGTKMNIPNRPFDFVKRRYPLTWFISFPYKWKCFMPF